MDGEMKSDKLWDYHNLNSTMYFDSARYKHDYVYKLVRKLLPNCDVKIAEIGFGNGYLLSKLILHYSCVCGLDISENNIDVVRKKIPKIKFFLIDAKGNLPFRKNEFDVIIATEVIEHMADEQISVFSRDVLRVLKKGGYLIGSVPANENLKANECFCPSCGTAFHRWGHLQSFNEARMRRLLKDFKLVFLKYYITRNPGRDTFERVFGFILWFARRAINVVRCIEPASWVFAYKK